MTRPIVALLSVLSVFAAPLFAHHSFGAEYDAGKPITITGVLTRIEWTNPHSFIYLDVTDGKGKRCQLEDGRISAERPVSQRLAEELHDESRRQDQRHRMEIQRRLQLGTVTRNHAAFRQENDLCSPAGTGDGGNTPAVEVR